MVKEYFRTFYGCKMQIKHSVTWVIDLDQETCRLIPNSYMYPEVQNFQFILTTIIDEFSCIPSIVQLRNKCYFLNVC